MRPADGVSSSLLASSNTPGPLVPLPSFPPQPLIDALVRQNSEHLGVRRFVTREAGVARAATEPRRVEKADLEAALAKLSATGERPLAFLCGPPLLTSRATLRLLLL